jgi:hypothetical protein
VAYRADIEIGVRGADRLKELQERVTKLSRAIDDANVKTLIDRKAIQSVAEYSAVLGRASDNLREAVIQLTAAGKASGAYAETISQYVTALGQANTAQATQNRLITDEIELRRKAKLAAAGIRETTGSRLQGPSLEQQGPASLVGSLAGQKSPVAEKINQTLQARKDEIQLQAALLRLEEKSAAVLNEKLELQQKIMRSAFIEEKQNIEALSAQVAQRQQFLAGKSGTAIQGPLAAAGAMGFPVALSLSKVEQKALEIAAKKQEILQRMAATKKDLVGLAGNLQRLDQNSVVAIADAARAEVKLIELKKKKAELAAAALKTSQAETKAAVALAKQQQTALAAKRKERSGMVQNALIGGAFPLLFGGGAGAVVGGFAGGFIPGNPMMSIVTSALGTMVDQFVASVAEMGVAVTSTSGTFDLMREKALFSSTAVEDQAIALEEQGKVTELANLLTQDLAKSIGGEGVRALQALGDETNILTKEWNLLTAQLFALVAGPLADFINALNTVLGGVTTENRLNTLRNEATPAQQKRLAEITAEERGGVVRNVRGGEQAFIAGPESTQVRQEILKRATAEGIVPAAPPGRVTSADRRAITAPRPKADRAARDAEREAERVAELVRSQALVTAELKRQEEFSAKIFAAELAKDPMLARRLKGEQQLVEWGYETANLLEKEESIQGQLAIARVQQAKQALILQKTTQDLVKLENDRVESANKDIAALENELKIKNALTQVERDRLRIEYEMQVLSDSKKFDSDQLNRIEDLKKQIAAPTLGADLIRQQIGTLSDELLVLTDVGTQVTAAAASIGDAFSASFKGVISGSMSAQEALASFFQSVADHFLDMAAQIIAKMITMAILNQILGVLPGIGGAGSGTLALSSNPNVGAYMGGGGIEGITMGTFGGTRAKGGPVSSGQTYMVGERGPELFVPGRSGTIVANDKMGGGNTNVVVNVDAKGSSVEGDQSQAKALGNAISAAVQSELVKQKRPGGLLA